MGKVLVISAHPDDEILGVGGTMLRHIDRGDEVCWLIVTNIFEKLGFSKAVVEKRQKEIELVAQTVKIERLVKLDYPTMTLSSSSLLTLIPAIAKIFNEFRPETIYCLNRSDAHSDHRIVFDAVMACTKSFRYPFIHKVLMYECISETEFAPTLPENVFIPNYFIDITSYIEKKMEIMKIYASELGNHPFPRSLNNISALATFRGSTAGVEYAEAFQLIKWIDK